MTPLPEGAIVTSTSRSKIRPAADPGRSKLAETAFDTMDSARKLKAAGIEVEHAEAIVEVMGQSVNHLVTREHFNLTVEHFDLTVERFDLTVKRLDAEIARLSDRIDTGLDSLRTELIDRIDTGLDNLRTELIDRIDTGLDRLRTELVARIDTGLAEVNARIDTGLAELRGRIDAVEKNMWRAQLFSVGVLIGAIALATSILGMMLTRSGGM